MISCGTTEKNAETNSLSYEKNDNSYNYITRTKEITSQNVNELDEDGNTELHKSAASNNIGKAKFLLDLGASLEILNNHDETPLMTAVKNNSLDVSEFLLQNGADLNVKSKDGYNLLFFAVQNNAGEMIELLINNGLNPNSKCINGASPLDIALSEGKINAAFVLRKNYAKYNFDFNHEELWNGFTSGMNLTQATNRCKVLFKEELNKTYWSLEDSQIPVIRGDNIENDFPLSDKCIKYICYPQNPSYGNEGISFYFYKNDKKSDAWLLFAIEINWAADGRELISAINNKYGIPEKDFVTEETIDSNIMWNHYAKAFYHNFQWNIQNKEIYFRYVEKTDKYSATIYPGYAVQFVIQKTLKNVVKVEKLYEKWKYEEQQLEIKKKAIKDAVF